MGASKFIGRVGGLAVALGVGAAAFSSSVASADATGSGSDPGGASRGNDSSSSQSASRGRKAAAQAPSAAPARIGARQQRNSRSDSAAEPSAPPVSGGQSSALEVDVDPTPAVVPVPVPTAAAVAAPSVPTASVVQAPSTHSAPPAAAEVVVATVPTPEPDPAPAGEVAGFLSEADNGLSDGADSDPLVPVDSPLAWALLAVARRQPLSAASTAGPVASVTTAQSVTSKGITVDPTVEFIDGFFQGTLNATSARGAALSYTSLGGSNGGKLDMDTVPVSPTETDPQSYTILPYATWLDAGGAKGTEQFSVRIRETTGFDQFLINIPVVGLIAAPVIDLLQQLPLISDLLAPIIGSSIVATIDVNVAADAPGDTPLSFTYDVISFDGTAISTNFFPATGIAAGETAPTLLNGPGLGSPGETDPYNVLGTFGSVPGVDPMRDEGYNVVTWDPRGEFASGGVLQLDSPFYEGRDASAIVSWAANNPLVELDAPGDPAVGMVGGSYGGGIQMVTASTDPRIDAIVPNGNWYSLIDALYPSEVPKTAWSGILLLDLVTAGARINNQLYIGALTGLFGFITQTGQAVLSSSGPTTLLNQLQIPTLLFQGTVDALFPLDQSVLNAETITENPFGAPVKMAWFCGGHGSCSTGVSPDQRPQLFADTFAWLNQYVAGTGQGADAVPVFQWWDQNADYYTSDLLPFQDGFNQVDPYSATDAGGTLGIIPFVGGSGSLFGSFPIGLIFPTPADNAINVALTPDVGDQIVGAPQLSFTYRGLGTGQAVFAQLVDDATGLVVGNQVTAVPLTLDGREHTVSMPLYDIAYTVGAGDSLTLQIASWSSIFANAAIGVVDITDIQVDLPLRDIPAVAVV